MLTVAREGHAGRNTDGAEGRAGPREDCRVIAGNPEGKGEMTSGKAHQRSSGGGPCGHHGTGTVCDGSTPIVSSALYQLA